jgi:hypothetical protein
MADDPHEPGWRVALHKANAAPRCGARSRATACGASACSCRPTKTIPGRSLTSLFTQALADLGWADGRNVRMDLRWGGVDTNRIRALAQELVGLQPDIILVAGSTRALPTPPAGRYH